MELGADIENCAPFSVVKLIKKRIRIDCEIEGEFNFLSFLIAGNSTFALFNEFDNAGNIRTSIRRGFQRTANFGVTRVPSI